MSYPGYPQDPRKYSSDSPQELNNQKRKGISPTPQSSVSYNPSAPPILTDPDYPIVLCYPSNTQMGSGPYESNSPYPSSNQPSPYPPYQGTGVPMSSTYPSTTPYPSQTSPYPQASPYPPQQSSYPLQSAPYPGQPSSYPGQPLPYPSQPSAYPGQQSYPSQPTGYPSQPTGYPSQPTGFTSQPSGYPNQPSGYPAQPSPYPAHSPYPQQQQTHQSHQESAYSIRKVTNLQSGVPAGGHSFPPQGQHYQKGTPTIRPAAPFDARHDAEILRKAMKGFGTDEKSIINVLCNRSNSQRQEIAVQFKTLYGKDLISDLKSELSGKFEDLIVALMTPINEFLAKEVHHAISGIGTNEETLVEILCTASNSEIHCIKTAYEKIFCRSMENDLSSDTSGYFRRLLISLCQGRRDENYIVNHMSSVKDAESLLVAGALQMGTDETTFISILATRSYPQLNQTFMEYHRLSGTDFEDAIKNEFSGDIERGLLAIVRSIKNKPEFFARQLHDSMEGMGTKDRVLIRIVVSRCEIDMEDIKRAFQHKYGQSLAEYIRADCVGDVEKAFLALIK